MEVTVTEAKNRLGQMLEHAQLIAPIEAARAERRPRSASEFNARYKGWVDEQRARFGRIGIRDEELRGW
jgi:hypothetical protein